MLAGTDDGLDEVQYVFAQTVADAGRHLVVARAGGVHLPAGRADAFDDGALDGLVDVLAVEERAVARVLDGCQRCQHLAGRLGVDYPLFGQHHDVRAVDGEVGREDALVVGQRGEERPGGPAREAVPADDRLVVVVGRARRFVVLAVTHIVTPPWPRSRRPTGRHCRP